MNALVSVVIRTYNRCAMVTGAIEGVLNQTYRPVEVIVVDDGSTDGTGAAVRRYGDRIRYVRQTHAGVAPALNTGIKHSTGTFLAFLDDDDLWRERMLEKAVHALETASEEVGAVYVDSRYFLDDDIGHLIDPGWKRCSGNLFRELLGNNFIPINAILIKKRCLDVVGGCDETLQGYEDWDLFLRIALAGFSYQYIDEALSLIRVRHAHGSANELMMKQCALAVVQKLYQIPGLTHDQRRMIQWAIARRRLSLGWYLMLQDHRDDGVKELRAASPVGVVQTAQTIVVTLLASLLGVVSLRRINGLLGWMRNWKLL